MIPAASAPPRMLPRMVVAIAAGMAMAMAFAPYDLARGWLAVPAVAVLVASLRGLSSRRGAVVAGAAGLGHFLLLLDWLRVLGPDAWILLSLLCAAFWAVAGALVPRLLRRPWWVLSVPLLWVVMEAARARVPWGGFPWGRLAYSQADTALLGWAALGGPALLSLVVALCATLALAAWDAVRARQARRAVGAVVMAALLAVAGGFLRDREWGGPDGDLQPIAVVQGNVPRVGLDFNAQRRAVLDNHVRVTTALAGEVAAGRMPQPVAVIWPENSSDIDPLRNADAALAIDRAADTIGAPILVGAVMANPADPDRPGHRGTVLNVGLVWDPQTGPGSRYVKRHPVPFGEYLPLRDVLTRLISRFERVPRDFAPGDAVGYLDIGPVPAGVVICFEIAYDELVRDAVRAGGQVLVVQTNNATYGGTGQPAQQLGISRVQAVASGRTTLVAATSGVSAVIGPDGALRWSAPEFTADATVAEVPMRAGLTPAVRLGGAVEVGATALLLGIVLLGMVLARGRRARDAGPTGSDQRPPGHATIVP